MAPWEKVLLWAMVPPADTADQFEFPLNDKRLKASNPPIFKEWREFRRVQKEENGLLTQAQAGLILGVTGSHVSVWVGKGRLSKWKFLGVPYVSAREVSLLFQEREKEGCSVGGRGHKLPSLREMVLSGLADSIEDAE